MVVLQEGGRRVELRWGGRMFDGEVVYATPEGCPCDLAMLRAGPGGCKGMQRVEFAEKEAVRGWFEFRGLLRHRCEN